MFQSDELYNHLLVYPKENNSALNSLLICSGYATSAMASHYLSYLEEKEIVDVKIDLIIGMTPRDGLRESEHKRFVGLMQEFPDKFSCSYLMKSHLPVHSKLYVWCEGQTSKVAFTGSANYTQTALFAKQGEIIVDCNPELALNYFHSFDSNTIYCNSPDVEDFVNFYRIGETSKELADNSVEKSNAGGFEDFPSVRVSFLTKGGNVGKRSGLNWGQRPEVKREPNQAYIPLKADVYGSSFFPERGKHFTVLTDDNKTLTCTRAQDNGKAIHTPLNNSQIGEYFRNRLGVANGEPVTKQHLEDYGRTDVEFYKIDEESYCMDFSRK